jgi:hypothetical protein
MTSCGELPPVTTEIASGAHSRDPVAIAPCEFLSRCCGAPKPHCCASRIAVARRNRKSRCWNGNSQGIFSEKLPQRRKEEDRSMRLHLDRKYLVGLDGNVVAFVVITLIIILAFVY